MADVKQLEFMLLRYVPNAVKEEFVNIGLLVREAGSGFATIRMTEDWSRVRCVDPEADVEVLTGLGLQLKQELQETRDWNLLVRKVEDLFSNVVQISPVKACLAQDAAQETDVLAKLYLERPRHAARGAVSGRQVILRGMEEAFEVAGVSGLLQRGVLAGTYTGKKGDPMKFDFAYPASGAVKFLEAVSLKADVQRAMLLLRFPEVARDILAANGAKAMLTAVVDDGLERSQENIGFALGTLEEHGIRVVEVGEMAAVAGEVRQELRA